MDVPLAALSRWIRCDRKSSSDRIQTLRPSASLRAVVEGDARDGSRNSLSTRHALVGERRFKQRNAKSQPTSIALSRRPDRVQHHSLLTSTSPRRAENARRRLGLYHHERHARYSYRQRIFRLRSNPPHAASPEAAQPLRLRFASSFPVEVKMQFNRCCEKDMKES